MPLAHNSAADPIVLLSSSPLPPPLCQSVASPNSSPLLSPSQLLRELVEKSTVTAKRVAPEYGVGSRDVWDIPDESDGEALGSKPPPERRRAARPPVAKKPRAKRTTEKSEKSTPKVGRLKAKVVKSATGTKKSRFFGKPNDQEHFIESLSFKSLSGTTTLIPKPSDTQISPDSRPTHAKDPATAVDTLSAAASAEGEEAGTPGFAGLIGELKCIHEGSLISLAPGVGPSGSGLTKKRRIEVSIMSAARNGLVCILIKAVTCARCSRFRMLPPGVVTSSIPQNQNNPERNQKR